MMRTEKVLINTLFSVLSHIVIFISAFAVRKIFVHYVNIDYLGYESLFSNIFSLLSVAEMGIGTVITYKLYEAAARDDKKEIVILLSIYKHVYRVVASFVLMVGLVIFFFLPFLIKDIPDLNYARFVYCLQLSSVIADYFLSYKRIIFIAQQQQYVCSQIEMCGKIIAYLFQIVVLVTAHSYTIYLLIRIISNVMINFCIKVLSGKKYPYTKQNIPVTASDIRKRNLFKDVRNFMVHKVSYAIYGGCDSIIISSFCGLRHVAVYGNYYAISSQVQSLLISNVLGPVQASLGNYVYSENDEQKQWDLFATLNTLSFMFAVYSASGYLVFFQPVMTIWMGEEYLLPYSFVILYSLTSYIQFDYEIVYKYRCTIGKYELDRNYMIAAAVLNILASIIGVQLWGISGVQFGTLLSLLVIVYARLKVVLKEIFHKSIRTVAIHHLKMMVFAFFECVILILLTSKLKSDILGLVIRLCVWGISISVMNYFLLRKDKYFLCLVKYLKDTIAFFVHRGKNEKI